MEIKDESGRCLATVYMNGNVETTLQLYQCFKHTMEHTTRKVSKEMIKKALDMALAEVA